MKKITRLPGLTHLSDVEYEDFIKRMKKDYRKNLKAICPSKEMRQDAKFIAKCGNACDTCAYGNGILADCRSPFSETFKAALGIDPCYSGVLIYLSKEADEAEYESDDFEFESDYECGDDYEDDIECGDDYEDDIECGDDYEDEDDIECQDEDESVDIDKLLDSLEGAHNIIYKNLDTIRLLSSYIIRMAADDYTLHPVILKQIASVHDSMVEIMEALDETE